MEIHKYFMNIADSESVLLDIIPSASNDSFILISSQFMSNLVKNSSSSVQTRKNLQILKILLCYQYKIYYEQGIKKRNFTEIDQFIKYLSNNQSKKNLSNISDIVILLLVLSEDKKNLLKIFDNFELFNASSQYKEVSQFSLSWFLKVSKYFLTALELLYFLDNKKKLKDLSRSCIDSIYEVCTSSILSNVTIWKYKDILDYYNIVSILEMIVIKEKNTKILNSYVHALLESDQNFVLTALCVISDLIFPEKNYHSLEIDYYLIKYDKLWILIQEKVLSSLPQERKEALYLFEKLCNFMEVNEKNIINSNAEKSTPFFFSLTEFQKFPISEVKLNFITIMEALEEKQQHLIIPVLPLLNNLVEVWIHYKSSENCFDFEWLYVIFVRLLQHDSNVVVKWGLLKSLDLDIEAYKCHNLLLLIIKTLNNTFLYEKSDGEKEPEIVISLITWFNKLGNENVHVLECFINLLNQVQWGPVAIFYVLQSILVTSKQLENSISLKQSHLTAIRSLIETNLKWHPVMLKSMSQITLIKIFFKFSDIQNLINVNTFLSYFPIKDVKEKSCWLLITSRLTNVEYKNAVNFIAQVCENLKENDENFSTPMSTFSLLVESLLKAGVIFQSENSLEHQELISLFIYLEKVDIRPYVKTSCIIKIIDLIHCLITSDDKLPTFIYKIFKNYKETIWIFLIKLFGCENFEYKYIETCTKILLNISLNKLQNIPSNDVEELEKKLEVKSVEVINNFHQHNSIQLLYALKLWSNISHLHKYDNVFFYDTIINLMKHGNFKIEGNESSGKISSEYYQALSLLIHNHVLSLTIDDLKQKNWFNIMSSIFDAAGNEVLIHFSNILYYCASKFENDDEHMKKIALLIKSFWSCNFGSKRDKLFWLVAQNLTKCINSRIFLKSKILQLVSQEYNEKMLQEAEKLPGLKFILIFYSEIDEHFDLFTKVILDGLLHGQVMRRDQRIFLQACIKGKEIQSFFKLDEKIENLDVYEFLNSQCNVDVSIRTVSVLQLCKALHVNNNYSSLLLQLILEKLLALQKKRYFANSYIHRLKHRIMQVLLILQPYLNQDLEEVLYYALKDSILHDSEQHSVNVLKKWILINIYLKNENILTDLWPFFDKLYWERPNSASFVIGIVWHIAIQIKENNSMFIKEALTKLGNCCMGQQFSMRLYGQVFFKKLYELLTDSTIRDEYHSLYRIILNNFKNNDLKKIPIKIDDEFFYTIFNPVKHYSLETIYYQLPRLSHVCMEEWLTKKNFEEMILNNLVTDISIFNDDTSFYDAAIPISSIKESENYTEDIDSRDISSDVQKKIMPKKPIALNEHEIETIFSKLHIESKKKNQNIIVVASLVEKSQNLGGIARTCEIFGSKELIISNLKQTQDKEFQVLSVSADRWLKISEIKPLSLCKYLSELKGRGWSIIGAEQTINSVNLSDFKFPDQTVLVLGNEKSGIPANILPMLDTCVEIPQQGVVRSLNVHVTSAICIWEYVKQHQFSD